MMKILRRAGFCAALAAALVVQSPMLVAATNAPQQQQKPTTDLEKPLSLEALHELVSRLTDSQVRSLLIEQLERGAGTSREPKEPTESDLAKTVDLFRERFGAMFGSVLDLPSEAASVVHRFSEGRRDDHLLLVVSAFFFTIVVALGAERLFEALTGGWRRRFERADTATIGARASQAVMRLIHDLASLAMFLAAVALMFFILYQGHAPSRALVIAAMIATLEIRLTVIAVRLLLAPRAAALRLLPIDDATAAGLARGIVILVAIQTVGHLVLNFSRQWGASKDVNDFMITLFGLGFVAVSLYTIWGYRHGIFDPVRAGRVSPMGRLVADLWPALMTAYVTLLFLASLVGRLTGGQFDSAAPLLSLFVVILLALVDLALSRALTRRHARRSINEDGSPPARASHFQVFIEGIHIAIVLVGLTLVARLWDIDVFALAASGVGERFANGFIDIIVAVLLAYFAWRLINTAIDRAIEAGERPQSTSQHGFVGASRLRTLLPLVRGFAFITICVVAILTALAAVGINIAPLLAGAGVLGIAIGFGAQTLVRDIISGAFYLMDDAFRLGEYVDVGDAKGTVEKIGIRSMQLRHHRGPLNIVPYGAIRRLNNQSRDWVVEKLELRLSYDADVAKVNKILKKIGQDLMADDELGPYFLMPLKSQGITAVQDGALVVRAKFTAKPGEQFGIRREAYQRIQKAFEENGIRFAPSQVAVFVPPDPIGVVATAAAQADAAAAAVSPIETAKASVR